MNTLSQVEPLRPVEGEPRSLPNFLDWCRTLMIKTWGAFRWIMLRAKAQQSRKTLRVSETVSLGEKRFVAVVQVDDERFLIGGSSTAVALLTRLPEAKTFAVALDRETARIS